MLLTVAEDEDEDEDDNARERSEDGPADEGGGEGVADGDKLASLSLTLLSSLGRNIDLIPRLIVGYLNV